MTITAIHRFFLFATLGALLGGCTVPPATDSNPINRQYRCDRNGDQEQRQAC